MSIELKIPEVGESVHEVQIGRWLKREGDAVALDENVVELETDKASMELPAPAAGILGKILKREGERITVGDVGGYPENGDGEKAKKPEPALATPKQQPAPAPPAPAAKAEENPAPSSPAPAAVKNESAPVAEKSKSNKHNGDVAVTPAARRALREYGLKSGDIDTKGDSLRRKDVLRFIET